MQRKLRWRIKISNAVTNFEGRVKKCNNKFEVARWMCSILSKIKESEWINDG